MICSIFSKIELQWYSRLQSTKLMRIHRRVHQSSCALLMITRGSNLIIYAMILRKTFITIFEGLKTQTKTRPQVGICLKTLKPIAGFAAGIGQS